MWACVRHDHEVFLHGALLHFALTDTAFPTKPRAKPFFLFCKTQGFFNIFGVSIQLTLCTNLEYA